MTPWPAEVYHSSGTQGLTSIEPREGTHGRSWVYATRDMLMSTVFLSTEGGDFVCATGRDGETGRPFICERFPGALDLRYGGRRGSIFVLPGEDFLEGQAAFDEEVVCSHAVAPEREIGIEEVREYLVQLSREGELLIKFHPERVCGIPDDDEDLVHKSAAWYPRYGNGVLVQMQRYHPHLVGRVRDAICRAREAPNGPPTSGST